MKPYILPLAAPQADLETVGGKGMSLAKLANAGLPVPGGFHVSTEAYRQFVDANKLQDGINAALTSVDTAQPSTLELASATISNLFAQAAMPQPIAEEILRAYENLGAEKSVAVRSSATAEDLPDASFAGQQETYLNMTGTEAVLDATKKCWASLWTARAIGYRARQGIGAEGVALAVVVQEMVFADAAGIMFTANPLNGRRDEIVINAAWGLGEAVVGGAVTPDTLTISKPKGSVILHEVAEKLVMTVRTKTGTEEQPVPDHLQNKAVLSDAQSAELAKYGREIEKLYGMPMDIEWTLVLGEGGFSIVQARPITALPVEPIEWPQLQKGAILARGSLAEHTPSPVSPLFATLGLRIANEETHNLWADYIGVDPTSMFLADGFYMAVNNYVYGGFILDLKNSWKLVKMSFAQMGPMLRGAPERWHAAYNAFAKVVDDWEGKELAKFTPTTLLDSARTVFRAAVKYYTVIQTTLPAASMGEIFFQRFYNALIKRKTDPEFTTFLFGLETMLVRAEKSLYDMAMWLKENPDLADYALRTPTSGLLAALRQDAAPENLPAEAWLELRARFDEHFAEFGRTAYEFDFMNATPPEEPSPQLEAIKLFVEGRGISPYTRHQEAADKREQATESVLKRVDPLRRRWFKKLLQRAQETGEIREDSIAAMGLGHPLIRKMLGELGSRFAAGDAIEKADDIYWLEEAEVEELVTTLENNKSMKERIPARKEKWQATLHIVAPVMLPEKSGWQRFIGGGAPEEKDGKTVLKGLGTSTGRVTAPACVLFSPEDFSKMKQGDVLVATTTTPAWTPLFALASAVVTDIGGPLSHSSIVAREYGIPAVMAARNATRHIKSGQMVTVDGKEGSVVLE